MVVGLRNSARAVETPLFGGGGGGLWSGLLEPWPNCKWKTKKGHYLLAIVVLYQLDYISLFATLLL